MSPLSVQKAIHKNAIGKTMILYILPVLLLFAVLTNISFFFLKKISNSYSDLVDRRAHILNDINNIQNSIYEENAHIREYLLTNNEDQIQDFYGLNMKVNQEIRNVIGLSKREHLKDSLKKIAEVHSDYQRKASQILSDSLIQKNRAVDLFHSTVSPLSKELINSLQEISDDQLSYMDGVSDTNDVIVNYTTITIIITGVLGFIIACVYINYISRSPLMKIKLVEK